MDELGLPVAFGKPTAPVKEAAAPARGGSSSRGERGVVGGGKKSKRGRGGASVDDRPDATSWDRSGGLTSQYDAFNGGVKRPYESQYSRPRPDAQAMSANFAGDRGRGRGRGRGAPRGGRGGFGGRDSPRKQDTFHGRFLKSSMWEDPWEEVMSARQSSA